VQVCERRFQLFFLETPDFFLRAKFYFGDIHTVRD
jgi:hypothetical protein